MPDQTQLAYTFPTGVDSAASARPARRSARPHYVNWNSFVPRLGMSYDLLGTGKTVLKLNYGMYRFNPGVGVAASANPNQATKSITYAWTDTKVCATCIPGDKTVPGRRRGSADREQALAGHDQRRPEHRSSRTRSRRPPTSSSS